MDIALTWISHQYLRTKRPLTFRHGIRSLLDGTSTGATLFSISDHFTWGNGSMALNGSFFSGLLSDSTDGQEFSPVSGIFQSSLDVSCTLSVLHHKGDPAQSWTDTPELHLPWLSWWVTSPCPSVHVNLGVLWELWGGGTESELQRTKLCFHSQDHSACRVSPLWLQPSNYGITLSGTESRETSYRNDFRCFSLGLFVSSIS